MSQKLIFREKFPPKLNNSQLGMHSTVGYYVKG